MSYHVTIQPGGHQFEANADETLLEAALRHGLVVPYGCRDGACGACKGKVVRGMVDQGKAQLQALKEEERAAGGVLFCCARAQSDLVLESRQVSSAKDIPVKTLPARVEKMDRPAPDVITMHLRLPANERLQFLAGQYIDILLKDGKRRSFSLANAPSDEGCLELHIRHVPGGLFTDQVFSTMKVRDILRFNGPHGGFYLREESAKPAILLASGTGFAPIKAMVEDLLMRGMERSLVLYWGARTRADLYMIDLPTRWAAEHPNFRFVPVLSEPTDADAWDGRRGFVHAAVIADVPDLSGFQVYACGAPVMIDAARCDFIGQCGLPEEEFFSDAFTFSPA